MRIAWLTGAILKKKKKISVPFDKLRACILDVFWCLTKSFIWPQVDKVGPETIFPFGEGNEHVSF